ncbi:MAG: C40 family peptidase [Syntrophorhabdales bacterium]|jgi:hypothetical protein
MTSRDEEGGGVARYATVKVPVANLREGPVEAARGRRHDDIQKSQLLFHETLLVTGEVADWFKIEALEQQKRTACGWRGYPGWVRRKDVSLVEGPAPYDGVVRSAFTFVRSAPSADGPPVFPVSLGTRLSFVGESADFFEIALDGQKAGWVPKKEIAPKTTGGDTQQELLRVARLFLGAPYHWGGRSMPMPWPGHIAMGVDCSGLVNLVFRALHVDVPRDAHDQWVSSSPLAARDLRPGDLIFLSCDGAAGPINHVMLSVGGEAFIEAAETGDTVREKTFSEKFGLDRGGLEKARFTVKDRRLCFGRITKIT